MFGVLHTYTQSTQGSVICQKMNKRQTIRTKQITTKHVFTKLVHIATVFQQCSQNSLNACHDQGRQISRAALRAAIYRQCRLRHRMNEWWIVKIQSKLYHCISTLSQTMRHVTRLYSTHVKRKLQQHFQLNVINVYKYRYITMVRRELRGGGEFCAWNQPLLCGSQTTSPTTT